MSRLRKIYVPSLLVILILWHCSENPSAPAGPVEKITLAAYAGDSGVPVNLAKELGYYKQNHLNVIIKDFESGKQATDAMLSGQADISTATDFVFVSNAFGHSAFSLLYSCGYTRRSKAGNRKPYPIGAIIEN